MNTYQKKYIRNWCIAVFIILFAAFNLWALFTGIVAVKLVWAGALVILSIWTVVAVVYWFIAEQIYNFRLRGVCENDAELNFLKLHSYSFHKGYIGEEDFRRDSDKELVKKFLSVKRPKWY